MKGLMEIPVAGFPERIHLKGHDEYTVKFSHLEAVATAHGYRDERLDVVGRDPEGPGHCGSIRAGET